jgi:FkbM family methyltransferase
MSRPRWRGEALTILRRLGNDDGTFWASYKQDGRTIQCCLRIAELASDLQSFLEVAIRDCYRVPRDARFRTIIDGGANTGLFTLGAMARWPEAKAIMIEPLAENVELIRRNLEANGMAAVVVEAALAREAGLATFYLRAANTGSLIATREHSGQREVPAMTLSSVYQQFADRNAACLIKLDIEGAEVEVLDEFLGQRGVGPILVVGELHWHKSTQRRMEAIVARHGYGVEYLEEFEECALFRIEPGTVRGRSDSQ